MSAESAQSRSSQSGSSRSGSSQSGGGASHPDAEGIVFRASSGIVFTCIAWAIAGTVIVTSLLEDVGPTPVVLAATGAWFAWLLLWRPSVVCFADRAQLRNLVRDVTVPYALIDDIDTRFTLTLVVGEKRYTAWGAPAPGKLRAMNIRAADRPGDDLPHELRALGSVRPGDLTSTASGAPATVIRRALDARRARGDTRREGAVTIQWRAGLLAASAVLAGASILALAVGL